MKFSNNEGIKVGSAAQHAFSEIPGHVYQMPLFTPWRDYSWSKEPFSVGKNVGELTLILDNVCEVFKL